MVAIAVETFDADAHVLPLPAVDPQIATAGALILMLRSCGVVVAPGGVEIADGKYRFDVQPVEYTFELVKAISFALALALGIKARWQRTDYEGRYMTRLEVEVWG